MKKLLFSAVATLAMAFALTSCSDNGPKATAKKFLESYAHMEYAAAKEVSTEATKKQLEGLEQMMGVMGGVDKKAKEEARKVTLDLKEPKMVNDSTATVDYILSNEPGATKNLKLVKQKGKWLAEWSKMGDMGGDAGMPAGGGMDMDMGGPTSLDTGIAPPADPAMDPTMDPNMAPTTPAAGDTSAAR